MRAWVGRTAKVLRDGWLVVGAALALLLALDAGYRAQAVIRLSRRHVDQIAPWLSPRHPQAGEPWWRDVPAIAIYGTNIRYDPYRGFWPTPLHSPVINVDSAGRRRTVQPPRRFDTPTVLFFGGSVMWGWIVPDSLTIPSLTAAELDRSGHPVLAINFAQPTFQITQETTTLLLELRSRRIPAVAVFLDGVNEVQSAYENGAAGHIYNEQIFSQRFRDGRDAGVLAQLARAGRDLALVKRLTTLRATRGVAGPHPEACPEVVQQYAEMTRMVGALGHVYGFDPLFLWQPMLPTTHKTLGPFERSVGHPEPGFAAMARLCTTLADSVMALRHDVSFQDLGTIFDRDSTDIFWDEHGHLTEAGNRAVAGRIAELVTTRIARASSTVTRPAHD